MMQKKTFSRYAKSPRKRPTAQTRPAAQKGITTQNGTATPSGRVIASREKSAELSSWWEKYASVENAIVTAQERRRHRAKAKRRGRAREFGDICEMSDGLAVRWRRDGFFEGEEFALVVLRDMGYYA